jgi:hypothetical protein
MMINLLSSKTTISDKHKDDCWIRGSCSSNWAECCLKGCNTLQLGDSLTFQFPTYVKSPVFPVDLCESFFYRQWLLLQWFSHSFFQTWPSLYQTESSIYGSLSFLPASAGFLLGLLFGPEDGGDVTSNIRLSSNYVALQPSRLYSSKR